MKKEKFEQRKEMLLRLLEDPLYRPMRLRDLAMLLNIPKPKRKALKEVIQTLALEGKLEIGEDGKIRRVQGEYLDGVFTAHSQGFGFVRPDTADTNGEDIFIPKERTGQAMHQDRVRVLLQNTSKGKRQEGRIVKILEHGATQIVGTYQRNRSYGFVIPDNGRITSDIFISKEHSKDAAHGDKVVVELTGYGSRHKSPEGKVVENLGNYRRPGVDILSIAKGYGIPTEFPPRVQQQARRIPDHVLEGDFAGRLDLRHQTIVTIDGEDAKDLDDGISLVKKGDIYHLGVHIADVSNYVQAGSALDKEALKRGTSVYLVDRVIPMLPVQLSNGICSLNQGEDRLALSCLMEINKHGKVVHHRIAETVIRVQERMTYTDVRDILEDPASPAAKKYKDLGPLFHLMAELSGILRHKRHRRGAIDFDFPESKITLSPRGKPLEVKAYERNVATDLIEDFMLLANETVAQEFSCRGLPFLYRTHENPDPEKITALLALLHSQGISAQKQRDEITPGEVQQLLDKIQGKPQEPMITRLALRTMKRARYTVECSGHFGLAARYYCHFTSPIRRYPDLQIHRIIKDQLRGRMHEERIARYQEILEAVAEKSSALERRAEETERETEKFKKAEYMTYHLGEEFDGVISGVTGWGLYVELPNTIEGLVHVNTLEDDYYIYQEDTCELVGKATKKTYRLGTPVRIRVADADPLQKTIDFTLAREEKEENEEKFWSPLHCK